MVVHIDDGFGEVSLAPFSLDIDLPKVHSRGVDRGRQHNCAGSGSEITGNADQPEEAEEGGLWVPGACSDACGSCSWVRVETLSL
jgi:hypothetical protein